MCNIVTDRLALCDCHPGPYTAISPLESSPLFCNEMNSRVIRVYVACSYHIYKCVTNQISICNVLMYSENRTRSSLTPWVHFRCAIPHQSPQCRTFFLHDNQDLVEETLLRLFGFLGNHYSTTTCNLMGVNMSVDKMDQAWLVSESTPCQNSTSWVALPLHPGHHLPTPVSHSPGHSAPDASS